MPHCQNQTLTVYPMGARTTAVWWELEIQRSYLKQTGKEKIPQLLCPEFQSPANVSHQQKAARSCWQGSVKKYHWQSSVTSNTEQSKGKVDNGSGNSQISSTAYLIKNLLRMLSSNDSRMSSLQIRHLQSKVKLDYKTFEYRPLLSYL